MLKKLFDTRIGFLKFFVVFFVFFSLIFSVVGLVSASETNGTIDSTYKYAWGENIGWINFGCSGCSVSVTDSALSGYAWSSQFGWINLNPTNGGVDNDGGGTLSGYAWSSNLGWINFSGVTINSSGEFLGYATLESNNSQINFNCATGDSCAEANFKVRTDWRPVGARSPVSQGGGGGYGGWQMVLSPTPVVAPIVDNIVTIVDDVSEIVDSTVTSIFDFFKPDNKSETDIFAQVSKIAPLSFQTRWNLLPVRAIRSFVFAPLPYEVRVLTSKFPELDKTLKNVGIDRLSDLEQLSGVTFNIKGLSELEKTIKHIGVEELGEIDKLSGVALHVPVMSNSELAKTLATLGVEKINDLDKLESGALGVSGMSNAELKKTLQALGVEKISDLNQLKTVALSVPMISGLGETISTVGVGKLSLLKGLPVSKFPLLAKKNLPTEFVFARAMGELVDLNVALSVGDRGEVTQTISSLPGKTLRLVVKPISRARSVTGYFVFKSATPRITGTEISRSSLSASALLSVENLVEEVSEPVPVENKLVLSSFEYTDLDRDGIYTADVVSPLVPGEYEVITVIDYIDPVLGVRQMRMITVIDPEGYVFEKNNGKETRIPLAIVSLYTLNTATKKYELWPAQNYQQENPQVTDVRGTYSFLVPEGSYYFSVEAPGYDPYEGKVFTVTEGSGVHQNIELSSGRAWLFGIDWKTVLLVVVFLLLVYNLYRNILRDRLLKLSSKNNGK